MYTFCHDLILTSEMNSYHKIRLIEFYHAFEYLAIERIKRYGNMKIVLFVYFLIVVSVLDVSDVYDPIDFHQYLTFFYEIAAGQAGHRYRCETAYKVCDADLGLCGSALGDVTDSP